MSECGASTYSASAVAATEFPDMDVTLRGAVSIARRLQDPLAEYVKVCETGEIPEKRKSFPLLHILLQSPISDLHEF